MQGPGAAELVYAGDRFTRVGGMPPFVLRLLQDVGSVQQLDGERHRHRKKLFVEIGRSAPAAILSAHVAREWKKRLGSWERADRIVLFDEIRDILTRASAAWAGIRLEGAEAGFRTEELSEMVEATGSVGPRKLRALLLRRRCEKWAQEIIRRVRDGKLAAARDSAVAMIASYRNADGNPLDVETAAVELLNVLRPTVRSAISSYLRPWPCTSIRRPASGLRQVMTIIGCLRRGGATDLSLLSLCRRPGPPPHRVERPSLRTGRPGSPRSLRDQPRSSCVARPRSLHAGTVSAWPARARSNRFPKVPATSPSPTAAPGTDHGRV